MAFSQALEEVIEAALADGVLTDKERAVLHKRAMAEGVDPDELDVVIEGRLAKMKRQTDWLKPAPPQNLPNGKVGNVMKCPACGAPYQPGMGQCPECGHVFQNIAGNNSAQRLADGISEITNRFSAKIASASDKRTGVFSFSEKYNLQIQMNDEISNFIASFVIPNAKDDLIQFMCSMDALRKVEGDLQGVYAAKYRETISKAKIIFPNDPQVMQLVKNSSKFSWYNLSGEARAIFLIIAGMAVLFLMGIIGSMTE